MTAWTLTTQEFDELDRLRFLTRETRVFRNAMVILLSSTGLSTAEIAETLGCSSATVDDTRAEYRCSGLKGLTPKSPPGRTSRATPEYRTAIKFAIATPPQILGYGFSVWSVNRLGQHLKKEPSVELSEDQFRRVLHQENF